LWRPELLAQVVAAIAARFDAALPTLEVTLEANPIDCTASALAAWRAAGVNRVSIGVQSLVPDELVVLGRDHRFGDGAAAVAAALDAGLRVSADHILGAPTPRRRVDPAATLDGLVDGGVGHLSVYELTIEARTSFGARVRAGRLVPLDEDALVDAYLAVHARLAARGFEHYEISSYARPGQRARHNSLYWSGAEFLGLGVSAASLRHLPDGSAERTTNPRGSAAYLACSDAELARVVEHVAPAAARRDRLWLAMRTVDGAAAAELECWPRLVAWLLAHGLAERAGDRYRPTVRGFLMADRVATQITDILDADPAPVG
jgi:coproporphyrinogen III oxidase-like Fe-S oxidoreductase